MRTFAPLDLYDPDSFADGVPHDLFAELRAAGPMWCRDDQEGFWAVGGHEDVLAATRDAATFSSAKRGTVLPQRGDHLESVRVLMLQDEPEHRAVRMRIQRAFTPRAIAAHDELARSVTRRALDAFTRGDPVDFANSVAATIPAEVIGELLGVAPADREAVARWAHLNNSGEDPTFLDEIIAEQPWVRLREYGARRRRELAVSGDDGTFAAMLNQDVDGELLTDDGFELNFAFLALAGNQTTRDAMTTGLHALLDHPNQMRALVQDRSLIPSAVEELLRWSTPVIYYSRTALVDSVVGGQAVAAGERVALYVASANFDPSAFDRPLELDVAREPNLHVTFGAGGPHVCIGAHLARLELRILLEELADDLHRIEIVEPPRRRRSHQTNSLRTLTLRRR